MRRLVSVFFTLGLLLMVCLFNGNQAFGMKLDADAAVVRANKFMKAVGWVTDKQPSAVYGGRSARMNAWREKSGKKKSTIKWNKIFEGPDIWEVKAGDLEVTIDPLTGNILTASRPGFYNNITEDVINITKEKAEESALAYLKATGFALNYLIVEKSEAKSLYSDPNSIEWRVDYCKYYKGFPYHRDGANVRLNPRDGSLIGLGYHAMSSIPTSTRIVLTKERARKNAVKYLKKLGFKAGKMNSIDLEIVQPNNYWDFYKTHSLPKSSSVSRLAYLIEFYGPWTKTEVWVDAGNGKILGGVHCRCFAGQKPKYKPGTHAQQGKVNDSTKKVK
jgi:hypothetical protein